LVFGSIRRQAVDQVSGRAISACVQVELADSRFHASAPRTALSRWRDQRRASVLLVPVSTSLFGVDSLCMAQATAVKTPRHPTGGCFIVYCLLFDACIRPNIIMKTFSRSVRRI